jgi:hypothetical protein
MSKCTKSKIHPSNHTTRSYNKSKSHTKHEFTPEGNLILAKVSHVNEALVDFKTEIYDEQEGEECHLVRILRIGPAIKDVSCWSFKITKTHAIGTKVRISIMKPCGFLSINYIGIRCSWDFGNCP